MLYTLDLSTCVYISIILFKFDLPLRELLKKVIMEDELSSESLSSVQNRANAVIIITHYYAVTQFDRNINSY